MSSTSGRFASSADGPSLAEWWSTPLTGDAQFAGSRLITAVPFPRPRSLELKRTPEFIGYVDQVWKLIEEEVRASVMSGES